MAESSENKPWLNRTVFGVGLTSLFSDWSHETATAVLPAFLATIGAGPAWLGAIEGIADGLSSFSKLAAGHYTDRLKRRKPLAAFGYAFTALATAACDRPPRKRSSPRMSRPVLMAFGTLAAVNAGGDFISSLLVGFLWSAVSVQAAFATSAVLFFAGTVTILRLRHLG
jgi:hypothetical protein